MWEKQKLQERYTNLGEDVCQKKLKLVLEEKGSYDQRREEFDLRWNDFQQKQTTKVLGCPDCRVTLSSTQKRY